MRWRTGPVHEHDLIIREKGEGDYSDDCPVCREMIPGQNSYWCTICRSNFHERCAKLALEIKFFYHPCPLFLHVSEKFRCNGCFDKFLGSCFTYQCNRCKFHLCVKCTSEVLSVSISCDGETEKEQALHCCDPHPLRPLAVEPDPDMSSCLICGMPYSLAPTWGCEQCDFYVHKPCLDFLPEEIVQTNLGSKVVSWVLQLYPGKYCFDCGGSIRPMLLFRRTRPNIYELLCTRCCLMRRLSDESSSQVPKEINHSIHPCPDYLKLILSPASSTCNACRLTDHQFSYHCNRCDFFLCLDCAQLPHFHHWHPLELLKGTQETTHICHLCKRLCFEPFYGCIELCGFYVHKSCMDPLPHKSSHLLPNTTLVLLHVRSFECTICKCLCSGLAFYCSERSCMFCINCVLWPDKLGNDRKFKSILHCHQLSQCETSIEHKRRRCFLCKEPCIPWTLSYKCSECDLFFHKLCAELPAQLEHSIHPHHPLTLTDRSSLPNEALTCKLCLKSLSQKFPLYDLVYRCHQDGFHLDTQCATNSMPSVEYKEHPHLLYVVANMHGNTNCRVCGRLCNGSCTIRCAHQECDFNLHLQCGPLPPTIKHPSHVHPLILKDYYVEDNISDEFACHTCEEERDPRLRVYCCSEGCLMICDIKCVLNEVLSILLGEHGDVELRTPFPQVECRVISGKSEFAKMTLCATIKETGDGNQPTNLFSSEEFFDAFSDLIPEPASGESISLDKEVESYSFSCNALSRFKKLLHTNLANDDRRESWKLYERSIMTGVYALPEILNPIYDEFFGKYNIIDHKLKFSYEEMRYLVCCTCRVLHEMRITKVVDVTKETIRHWLRAITNVEEKSKFNLGFVAENIKQLWQAHYYIQSKKIVDDKSSQLERELEQAFMYKAELRTKMDEVDARIQELQVMAREHDAYTIVGSRGPMKKVRRDALEIKWRTCYESLITYPGNAPAN